MKPLHPTYNKLRLLVICYCLCIGSLTINGQNLDAEAIAKATALKVSGGVSANTVFYSSNNRNARAPFTYFLQGNINVSWLTFSMPLSYSFSNQGANLDYQIPFKFNRLSLHPKYKWIQAHIGDVAMTFSPYTLSGHQFTGGGIDLTPPGSFKISAMAGRLLKATEDDGNEKTLPAYQRMGYGAKLKWEKERYKIGFIGFYAKDDITSVSTILDDRDISPKENMVISIEGEATISDGVKLKAEYASTAITQDIRADNSTEKGGSLAGIFFKNKNSTEYYNALKAGLDFKVAKASMGLAYERIDPGYETLGAYFFNNDFENITLNASRPLFNNKLNLSFNIGYQRDNLESQKAQETNRFVGAANATLNVTEKVTLTGSYSNFSIHTNRSLNQFDDINDSDLTDEDLEALDFKQLSQNANININWLLVEGEKNTQNLNLNYSLASSANEQAGVVRVGQANNFHNGNVVYTIGFPTHNLDVSTALNYNYSDIGRDDSDAIGANIDVSKKLFENKLSTTFGVAYNISENKNTSTDVLNFRASATLIVAKKHNFNLNAVQLFRSTTNQDALNELTVTFGYSYAFSIGKPKLKKRAKKEKQFEFSYKTHVFKGAHYEISAEIAEIIKTTAFRSIREIKGIVNTLNTLEEEMHLAENKKNSTYKNAALNYLKYLYKHKNFLDTYHNLAFKSLKKLHKDAIKLDHSVKKEYMLVLAKVNTAKQEATSIKQKELDNLAVLEKRYMAHSWMQEQLRMLTQADIINNKGILSEFKKKYISKIFEMIEAEKSTLEIEKYLELKFADFYHKKSYSKF